MTMSPSRPSGTRDERLLTPKEVQSIIWAPSDSPMSTDERLIQAQFAKADAYWEPRIVELLAVCMEAEAIAALAELHSDEYLAAGREIVGLGRILRAVIAHAKETQP